MFRILTGIFMLLMMALAGCSSLGCGDPHAYLNSPSRPALKAPAGLSVPAPDPAYAVNGSVPMSGKNSDRDAAGVCLINPPRVLPVVDTGKSKPASVAVPAASHSLPPASGQPPTKPA